MSPLRFGGGCIYGQVCKEGRGQCELIQIKTKAEQRQIIFETSQAGKTSPVIPKKLHLAYFARSTLFKSLEAITCDETAPDAFPII